MLGKSLYAYVPHPLKETTTHTDIQARWWPFKILAWTCWQSFVTGRQGDSGRLREAAHFMCSHLQKCHLNYLKLSSSAVCLSEIVLSHPSMYTSMCFWWLCKLHSGSVHHGKPPAVEETSVWKGLWRYLQMPSGYCQAAAGAWLHSQQRSLNCAGNKRLDHCRCGLSMNAFKVCLVDVLLHPVKTKMLPSMFWSASLGKQNVIVDHTLFEDHQTNKSWAGELDPYDDLLVV